MSKFEIDEDLIRKLAKLLKETGLTEIEYDTDAARIRVSAAAGAMIAAATPQAPLAAAPSAPSASARPGRSTPRP